MQKQILELHKLGESDRAIPRIVGKNRRTVTRIVERGEAVVPNAEVPAWAQLVDWEKVRLQVSKGVQGNILAREHAEGTISYVQFWRQFHKKYPDLPTVTMRLDHKSGERMYFDYTEGVDVVYRETGEVKATQLMCGDPRKAPSATRQGRERIRHRRRPETVLSRSP